MGRQTACAAAMSMAGGSPEQQRTISRIAASAAAGVLPTRREKCRADSESVSTLRSTDPAPLVTLRLLSLFLLVTSVRQPGEPGEPGSSGST
ncbi:hypothetical protein [Streptomyces sp. NPDC058247]|uniref:hypothetical protein n=1 Tax=Streptomyces sp. NPDC058247 TaxID=3346401 RepID=UPI0036E623B8